MKENNRIQIKDYARSCAKNSEEYHALIAYGYRQNTAMMCKKLMITISIMIAIFFAGVAFGEDSMYEKYGSSILMLLGEVLIYSLGFLMTGGIVYTIYRMWKVVSSFDIFGVHESYTPPTETYLEITHVSGNTYEGRIKERDAYDGELGKLAVYVFLWLTVCVWMWFYYLWVRLFSVKICRSKCSDESFHVFSEQLTLLLNTKKQKKKTRVSRKK